MDLFLVPTMLSALGGEAVGGADKLQSVERVVNGGSQIDDALLDCALDLLPCVGFVQAYSMTELSPIATMLGPDDHLRDARASRKGRSAGRATTAAEVRIVDEDDRARPRGIPDEIVVRGDGVMLGY